MTRSRVAERLEQIRTSVRSGVPQLPLAAVDNGIVPYVGSYDLLEAHKQNLFQDKPAEAEAPMRRVSEITAATCLQILVPLLIVLLGFSSVTE